MQASCTALPRMSMVATRRRSEAMKTIKGPAIFLAQFTADAPPFNTLDGIAKWAAGHGYVGVQIPSWGSRLFDLSPAAASKTYCAEAPGASARHCISPSDLSSHLQPQLFSVHPPYGLASDAFAPHS